MRIKDIAKAVGVSTATVSRALGDKPNVRPELRQKVQEAARRLHYTPNRMARSLRSKRSSFIGLIVADIENPFFASVCRAVEDVAQANDYSVILCNTDENPEKERMYLELMRSENPAGLILAPTGRLADAFPIELAEAGPLVVIDRRVRGAAPDCVLIDNHEAARELAAHMLGHGYRRIAGIFGANSVTGRERRAGFLAALQAAGVGPEPDLIVDVPARETEGYAAAMTLLARANPPEAVVTSSSLLAAGAFRAIREKELSVPEAVAFATFDESLWTAMIRPAVTVVAQPTYAIGQTAGEMLLRRIEDPARPSRTVVLGSRLIVRQSCGVHGGA
ncbi:MAG: LacI family DNA-binding transcriptional regulator [Solidesulfovibrio sp.]